MSACELAKANPSGRIQPLAEPMRSRAALPEVEIQAMKSPGRPALAAAARHLSSAPCSALLASPFRSPLNWALVTKTRLWELPESVRVLSPSMSASQDGVSDE